MAIDDVVEEAPALEEPAREEAKKADPLPKPEKDLSWRVKHDRSETTLADVRAAAKAEKQAHADDGQAKWMHTRKINIHNYTSEDSFVKTEKLYTYYCSICGNYSLILPSPLSNIPFRRTDKSYVIDESGYHKQNVNTAAEATNIRRNEGIEVQFRLFCKDCKQPMGYRLAPKGRPSPYAYYWKEAVVQTQALCHAFKDKPSGDNSVRVS